MRLGDVVVSRAARFQCVRDFKDEPFNGRVFESRWPIPTARLSEAERLMGGFAEHLTGLTTPKGTPPDPDCGCSSHAGGDRPQIYRDGTRTIPAFHPILTTDIFEFGTNVNRLDTLGMAVEMDDACLGLACSELASPPKWACVRNVSDPVINGRPRGCAAGSLCRVLLREVWVLDDRDERAGDVGHRRGSHQPAAHRQRVS
jgi:hypothetical protein